jgi:hypothetical protein
MLDVSLNSADGAGGSISEAGVVVFRAARDACVRIARRSRAADNRRTSLAFPPGIAFSSCLVASIAAVFLCTEIAHHV